MFKHPRHFENHNSTVNDEVEKNANRFYWGCFVLSGSLLGWKGFWLNYNEIGAQSHPSMAIPVTFLFFMLAILCGGMCFETLSRTWKYILGLLFLIAVAIATDPIRMIIY